MPTRGLRRRYKGRMVGPGGAPRSNENVRTPSGVSFTMGDTAMQAVGTKFVAGQFKVSAPTKRVHRKGIYRSVS